MTIAFRAQGERNPRNPSVGTRPRPDIVAYEEKRLIVSPDEVPIKQEYTREDDLTWAQVEITAKHLSSGDDDEKGLLKAITYTLYHLLSRPDSVVVPGFYFGTKVFNLIFTSASASCNTKLEWGNPNYSSISSAGPSLLVRGWLTLTSSVIPTTPSTSCSKRKHVTAAKLYPLENQYGSKVPHPAIRLDRSG